MESAISLYYVVKLDGSLAGTKTVGKCELLGRMAYESAEC